MNRKIISVPCIVNAWLKVLSSTNWRPGTASSLRMTRARSPAKKKNTNALTMYRTPIFLWSTVVSQSSTHERA